MRMCSLVTFSAFERHLAAFLSKYSQFNFGS